MIRIVKPQAPPVLTKEGIEQKTKNCDAYDQYANDYVSGTRKFVALKNIYAAPSVKQALILAQHKKCAFCESYFAHVSYGDVEHLRPKGGYKQDKEDTLHCPGYYWLAYDWTNLFASCQLCNQQFKKNLFPLANPTHRAINHHNSTDDEDNLLIDPGAQNPEHFISFRREIPYAIADNPSGKATIEICGLDRKELTDIRIERLEELKTLFELVDIDKFLDSTSPQYVRLHQLAIYAQRKLQRAQEDMTEYAAAKRAAFSVGFSGEGWGSLEAFA